MRMATLRVETVSVRARKVSVHDRRRSRAGGPAPLRGRRGHLNLTKSVFPISKGHHPCKKSRGSRLQSSDASTSRPHSNLNGRKTKTESRWTETTGGFSRSNGGRASSKGVSSRREGLPFSGTRGFPGSSGVYSKGNSLSRTSPATRHPRSPVQFIRRRVGPAPRLKVPLDGRARRIVMVSSPHAGSPPS